MIQNIIAKIRKYIPIYPPLQSFNACNPLIGLHELSFAEALILVAEHAPIFGTLPLHKYHLFWQSGKITIHDLNMAIKKFVVRHKIDPTNEAVLLQLMLNKSLQLSLEIMDDKHRRYVAPQASEWLSASNQSVFRFVARFYDIGQAKWQMPVKSNQLFSAWLEYAQINYAGYSIISRLDNDSLKSIAVLLQAGGIESAEYEQYLLKVLFQVIGWASFVHWLEFAESNPYVSKQGKLADIIAIWLAETIVMQDHLPPLISHIPPQLSTEFNHLIQKHLSLSALPSGLLALLNRYQWGLIWQAALEHNYQDNLIRQISLNKQDKVNLPKAQALFCVDVRSEGLRRHLESYANYETFGTTGFFGIGFDFHFQHHVSRQNPDWSSSHHSLHAKNKRLTPMVKIFNNLLNGVIRTKKSFLGPLVLFDVVGLWYSLRIMGNNFIPLKKNIISHPELGYNSFNIFKDGNFSVHELGTQIAKLLRSIGLNHGFADLILICGHLGESVNNPFGASLHCGACGGNSGAPNAIAFCQAANDQRVREYLRLEEQIDIPAATQFVAATHNTTTDQINYYYDHSQLTTSNLATIDELKTNLTLAGADLCQERQKEMEGQKNVNVRKSDWAELQPELGQVNNAALVIGPRELTKNLNLHRRVFLQSYDYNEDHSGEILNDIFNSTVKVVNMINSQYYFSTTDHKFYGSGNKAIQNIVSQIGVMEGNSSDLKIGLSRQSLFFRGEPIHLPLRLCIIVQAKHELVEKILAKNQFLSNLIEGDWVSFNVV